jgi:cystinosin
MPGFLAYLVSNALFYYSPLIRAQYAARYKGLTPTVQFNDITFALHAMVVSVVMTSQYFPALWGFPPSPHTRPSRTILGVAFGSLGGVAIIAATVAITASRTGADLDPRTDWCALDLAYAISYVKLFITLIKYTPQVIINIKNRSTEGWSIVGILLDLTGGILSIGQQGIDSWLQRDWSGITGNPVKFALGNVSIVYDVIFVAQHFVLYAGNNKGEQESESRPLLGDQQEGEHA